MRRLCLYHVYYDWQTMRRSRLQSSMKTTIVPSLKVVSGNFLIYNPVVSLETNPICLTEQYNETFSESAEVGSQIFRVIATDADSGIFGEVTYSILSGNEVKITKRYRFENSPSAKSNAVLGMYKYCCFIVPTPFLRLEILPLTMKLALSQSRGCWMWKRCQQNIASQS